MIVIGIDQKVWISQFRNQYGDFPLHPVLSTGAISETNRSGILWTFITAMYPMHRIRKVFKVFFWKLNSNIGIFHQLRWNNCKNWFSIKRGFNFVTRSLTKICFATSALGILDFTQFLRNTLFRFSSFVFFVELEVPTFWWRSKFPITSFPITFHARYLNHVLAKLAEKMNHSCKIWNPLKTTPVTLNSIVTVRKRSGKSILTSKISQTEFYGSQSDLYFSL